MQTDTNPRVERALRAITSPNPDPGMEQCQVGTRQQSKEVVTTTERFTPERCKEILERSGSIRPNFRKPRLRQIESYAADMREGRWYVNGKTIVFDGKGCLVDGQHRMLACIEAGVPFTSLVVRGVTDDRGIDIGAKRTATEYLKHSGLPSSTGLAAAARMCVLYDRGVRGWLLGVASVGATQTTDYIRLHPGLADSWEMARQAAPTGVSTTALAYVHFIGGRLAGSRLADKFVEAICAGGGAVGDPVTALRRYAEYQRAHGSRDHSSRAKQAAVIKAWNWWVTGRRLIKITVAARGNKKNGAIIWEDFAEPPYRDL